MTGAAAAAAESPSFAVLLVCTANICRSPAAEALLRAELAAADDVEVASAGLTARVGSAIAPEMANALAVPVTGFQARQVTSEVVGGADLVLTMTREQRAALVALVPAAVRRTFTLKEFAALVALAAGRARVSGASTRQRLSSATAEAPRFRSARVAGAEDDIADPYGGRPADYSRAAGEIEQAVAALVSAVGPS
ncbi:hypothetical protein O2V63_02045 [Modestobacter sp. VKM Ac-2977]|uniref:arsenate reductase/protein-tyrosine-phosphatase family protein n=1 Tax=Modestobacter sp. VKM Ac-2977 TaxID=3004131 RepID=UPI0022AB288C|nr:hypothetical protein [Modestobacter sp. VKM Ac-2977]MCZ2819107.1 hypothetical protein [Modestobacter sp. VKM Ac-2977]